MRSPGIVSAISIAAGVPLLLSMAGLLSSVPYLVAMLAIGAAGAASCFALRTRRSSARRRRGRSPDSSSLATGAALSVLAFIPTLLGMGTGHPDSTQLPHRQPRRVVPDHSLWTLPYQSPGFFTATHPANGELAAIGMLFATQGDQLVYTANIAFGALAVLACATDRPRSRRPPAPGRDGGDGGRRRPSCSARRRTASRPTSPAPAGLVAGVAALLRARHEAQHRVRWIVLAGLALGFAMGAKYTVLFLVPVVVAGAVLRSVRAATTSGSRRGSSCSPDRGSSATGSRRATRSSRSASRSDRSRSSRAATARCSR